ncbi:MAG TPA: hypothetical protein VLG11_03715 [Candidatus Saccharimonadales bacterium]|nr:hypothetical protein [Candidatus Saccharimonadales bacterium]
MKDWTFYPVFIASVVSVIGLTHIAFAKISPKPRTLSELAAAEQTLLARFRNVLLFCGTLFAITVFWFIIPRIAAHAIVAFFGSLMIGGELLAAIIPARHKTIFVHNFMAQTMALGMLGLAFSFWFSLPRYNGPEMLLAIGMCVAGGLTFLDKKYYLQYELGFIYASHCTVALAALALRWHLLSARIIWYKSLHEACR